MSAYRQPEDRPSQVLHYGPFAVSWWPVIASFVVTACLLSLWAFAEWNVFRSIECRRPGQCVVTRGSDLFGARRAETFAVDQLLAVEVQRRAEKSHKDVLVLVDVADGEHELLDGEAVHKVQRRLRPFLDDKRQTEVTVVLEPDGGGRVVLPLCILCALLVAVLYTRSTLRERRLVRLVIDRAAGVLRVEQARWRGFRVERELPLADITGVRVVRAASTSTRARLEVRIQNARHVPLKAGYSAAGSVHDETADALRDALGR